MSDIVPIAAPLPLPSAMYPLGMVSLAAPGSEALLLLAPETLEVVDRLRAPAPVLRQAWSADGMALALTHAARRGTALSLVDFRRGQVHGPVEAPAQLEADADLVALENGVALADRAGRRVLLLTLRGGEMRMRAIRLPLAPHLLARSHDGAWLAVGGGPGEGIIIIDPQSGQTVATWGDGGEAEGALAALAPGPTPGDWLAGEEATG
ncbi:MAG: hypothetical protein NTZ05_02765, partial [Chloroflexi bacterium]|nr:hypothetical protein [Chloroflexota bacterium]